MAGLSKPFIPLNKTVRNIRFNAIEPISDEGTGSSGATDHSHPNLPQLNRLGIQDNRVITIDGTPAAVPLNQTDW